MPEWIDSVFDSPWAPVVAFVLGAVFNAIVSEVRTRGAEGRASVARNEQWDREDRSRRISRGEQAVLEIHQMLDAALEVFRKYEPPPGEWYSGPEQQDFEEFYYGIRRRSAEVPDEAFRNRMDAIVELMYQWGALLEEEGVLARETAYKAHSAGRALVVSWLDSATVPDQPEVLRLRQVIDDHYEERDRQEREWREKERRERETRRARGADESPE